MTETLLMLYTMFAAAGTFALLSLLGAVELRAGGSAAATPLCARNTCVS